MFGLLGATGCRALRALQPVPVADEPTPGGVEVAVSDPVEEGKLLRSSVGCISDIIKRCLQCNKTSDALDQFVRLKQFQSTFNSDAAFSYFMSFIKHCIFG